MSTRTIKVEQLARVEGEGALDIRVEDGRLVESRLRIFEPPRFFEALLRGRRYTEAPDITARICGICPVAYLLGASQAMEDVCGAIIPPEIRRLRRLIYCGEWIESHVLHMYMLHAPDFLGYPDAIALAKDQPQLVQRALRMKKIGNEVMRLIGGREIHPINLCVGGFYRAPGVAEVRGLLPELRWGLEAALETVRLLSGLSFPEFEPDYEFICMSHPDEYAITQGRLISNRGIDAPLSRYDDLLAESHEAHSTALHSRVVGRGTAHLGPLARYSLNYDRLTPLAQQAAQDAGLGRVCRNPFKSILVRGVETIFAFEESIRLADEYQPPAVPHVPVTPRAGIGYGSTEAPRGICYHRYALDAEGIIQDAKIVSPTAVNQPTIEHDLRAVIERNLDLADDRLQALCEQTIRNYDPCISCAAHFLRLRVERI